ncbi:MAG TPA: 2-oxo acid dehydrogenase subunit E2, partial [Acidimicrobiales bacterium]
MDGIPGQNGSTGRFGANDLLGDFGANDWLVDEMRDRWNEDPDSVPEEWRSLFDGGPVSDGSSAAPAPSAAAPVSVPDLAAPPPAPVATAPAPTTVPAPAPVASVPPVAPAPSAPVPSTPAAEGSELLRGAAARIVTNMEASLQVPTATSFRVVPAKLLEVNRTVINGYLGRTQGGKVSFTHLIGYAVVKGLQAMPAMNRTYTEVDGKPAVIRHQHVGLGLAVDVEK